MVEVLDLAKPDFPLNAEIQHQIELSPQKTEKLLRECNDILAACGDELAGSIWFNAGWLDRVLKDAPTRFNSGFDRWRELYASAVRQRDEARVIVDKPTATNDERKREKGRLPKLNAKLTYC